MCSLRFKGLLILKVEHRFDRRITGEWLSQIVAENRNLPRFCLVLTLFCPMATYRRGKCSQTSVVGKGCNLGSTKHNLILLYLVSLWGAGLCMYCLSSYHDVTECDTWQTMHSSTVDCNSIMGAAVPTFSLSRIRRTSMVEFCLGILSMTLDVYLYPVQR